VGVQKQLKLEESRLYCGYHATAEGLDLVHCWCTLACKWKDSVQRTAELFQRDETW
jgi:hypothetical protein